MWTGGNGKEVLLYCFGIGKKASNDVLLETGWKLSSPESYPETNKGLDRPKQRSAK
jgi:hypothetical protein